VSDPLGAAARHARAYLDGLAERPVNARASVGEIAARLGGPLPERGTDPAQVVDELAAAVEDGLVATPGPRYLGFVTGGALPAALAADWLTSAWDQNAALAVMSPAAAAVETVAARWLLEALGLPAGAGVGVVTGGQMANFTCLAAARNAVLARAGWDVEADGLQGAPAIRVVAGEQVHVAAVAAVRYLGLGAGRIVRVPADDQGRMRAGELGAALDDGPAIVLAQAGEVNTGAFDPLAEIVDVAHERGAWVHVDGAFGLWAAASPSLRHRLDGHERADSWAVDGHKWLNVPYDTGYAIVADAAAHAAALGASAAYLQTGGDREGFQWAPEASRRARAFPTYAALRQLGREGIAALVDGCCAHARTVAGALRGEPGVEVLNDVVLNQVLVRVGDDDRRTRAAVAAVQGSGEAWLGATTFRGRDAMRVSVSGWRTTEADADRCARAIVSGCRVALRH